MSMSHSQEVCIGGLLSSARYGSLQNEAQNLNLRSGISQSVAPPFASIGHVHQAKIELPQITKICN
uniref:Uncharacterized protein n=1 Tax=Oryza barthii TaxID=65489 RepID=A0A0D3EJX4_9ORYZ